MQFGFNQYNFLRHQEMTSTKNIKDRNMSTILNLQALAVEDDSAPMEWSTISNHCGSQQEIAA